jgi:hypothetical protein
MAVWWSNNNLGMGIGTDFDILFSLSANNGASWTAPQPLNTNAATDIGAERSPQLTTDGLGNWLALWMSWDSHGGTIGADADVLVSGSTDIGATWTDPLSLNTNAATDSGEDEYPPAYHRRPRAVASGVGF